MQKVHIPNVNVTFLKDSLTFALINFCFEKLNLSSENKTKSLNKNTHVGVSFLCSVPRAPPLKKVEHVSFVHVKKVLCSCKKVLCSCKKVLCS